MKKESFILRHAYWFLSFASGALSFFLLYKGLFILGFLAFTLCMAYMVVGLLTAMTRGSHNQDAILDDYERAAEIQQRRNNFKVFHNE